MGKSCIMALGMLAEEGFHDCSGHGGTYSSTKLPLHFVRVSPYDITNHK